MLFSERDFERDIERARVASLDGNENLEQQSAKVAYLSGVALRDLLRIFKADPKRDLQAAIECAQGAFLSAMSLQAGVKNLACSIEDLYDSCNSRPMVRSAEARMEENENGI